MTQPQNPQNPQNPNDKKALVDAYRQSYLSSGGDKQDVQDDNVVHQRLQEHHVTTPQDATQAGQKAAQQRKAGQAGSGQGQPSGPQGGTQGQPGQPGRTQS